MRLSIDPVRAGALAFALLLPNAASGAPATGEPYAINTIVSLTGPGAFLGKSAQVALGALEASVNRSGGINGRPIHFALQDDGSNPQVTVQLANDLIAKKVPVVLGPELSSTCGAVAPLFHDGPVDYCLSGGFFPQPNGWVFNYGPMSIDSIDTNVRYFRLHGYTKIAFLTSVDATGQDGERSFDRALALPENKVMQVVDREHYAVNDPSVAAQIARIQASGAQALFTWGTGTPMGTVFRGISDAGLDIPVSMSAPNLVNAEMKQYAAILPKNLVVAGMAFMVPDALPKGPLKAAVLDFDHSIQAATGEPADIGTSIAWDPALVLISAFRKLGLDATAPQLREYITNLHGLAGANGIYDFRNGNPRGLGMGWAIMIKWDPVRRTWVGASAFGGRS